MKYATSKFGLLISFVLLFALTSLGQTTVPNSDVLGVHDLGSGRGGIQGPNSNACIYCHVPHGGSSSTPLWNQTLSTQTYAVYSSDTEQNTSQPLVNRPSMLCLSCHDGTVAVGQTLAIGNLTMSGTMSDVVGTKLQGSHPFSLQLPLKDSANLISTLASSHTTKDEAVKLIDNNVECSTCHDVHNQYKDKRNQEFLVRDNTGGQLCLACHETTARTVNGRTNSLAQWTTSIHATSTAQVAPKTVLGNYSTVAEFGCSTCHVTHNATGSGLLRKNASQPATVDGTSQSCLLCHDGGNNLAQPILNILGETQKIGHPFGDSSNPHTAGEATVLDNNRHATCADCHNAHASSPTTVFTTTGEIRPSQANVNGIRADGSAVAPATYQYENCLRCHSTSANKQSPPLYGYMPARGLFSGDTLNVALQFNTTAVSSHPVMRDAKNVAQPSLLTAMWDISGQVQNRSMGTRILCTDCHNSDNNREFGGTGPNGPHGSKNEHILERRYLTSTVSSGTFPTGGPGSPITNLAPTPTLDPVSSPYAMCAKCHNLTNVMSNASFSDHSGHITAGISCSTCHSAHGVPTGTSSVTGQRLVSFDLNVVAPYNGVISYNGSNCTLTCHMWDHNGTSAPTPHQP